jgi:uncharacterized membrane protein
VADRRRRDRRRLSAGVYLAFSTFVMPGLRKLPPAHAISAMNSINKAAPSNPLLTLVLFGTGIVCVLVRIAGSSTRATRRPSGRSPAPRG